MDSSQLDHLSYSSIIFYLMCGAGWKFHYLDKVPVPTSPERVFGGAIHNTVEQFIGNDHQGDITAHWAEHWAAAIKDQQVDWGMDTPEFHQNEGSRILGHADIQRGILSIKAGKDDQGPIIERRVELAVPGVPIPIVGYIDIITADGVPGDFKTSSKSWSGDKAESELQPLFYLAALNQAGHTVKDWRFRHFVMVKTKTPQFQVLEHTHNPGQLMFLFKLIREVWQAISAGVYPPNPGGWKCSPTYCEYWSMCRGKHG